MISRSALVSELGPRSKNSESMRIGSAVSGRNASSPTIPGNPSGSVICAMKSSPQFEWVGQLLRDLRRWNFDERLEQGRLTRSITMVIARQEEQNQASDERGQRQQLNRGRR